MGTHQRLVSDPIAGLRGAGPYPTYMPQQPPQPQPYNTNPRSDWVDERMYNGR
ncbi:hypothetical protein AAF712_006005 [Marasmius tenuissimus]|uniref:Uncharacterized protein n=1 Tax=Marasmius tenuissimus TaxID=585030 RepID=A0ABR2ZZH4_9AGAR